MVNGEKFWPAVLFVLFLMRAIDALYGAGSGCSILSA